MADPFDLPVHTHDDPFYGFESWRPVPGEDIPFLTDRKMIEVVQKTWGQEEIIINGDLYCGKILTIRPGEHTSYHYHAIKDETFYVLQGQLVVYIGNETQVNRVICLEPGEKWRIRPDICHTIACPNNGVDLIFFEFSTHDYVTDSYRVNFPS